MATAMKTASKVRSSIPTQAPRHQSKDLRKDRILAVVVLVAFAALLAMMIWLSTLGGGPAEPVDMLEWPML